MQIVDTGILRFNPADYPIVDHSYAKPADSNRHGQNGRKSFGLISSHPRFHFRRIRNESRRPLRKARTTLSQ